MSYAVATATQSDEVDLATRAATYLFFARLFREAPTPEFLQQLINFASRNLSSQSMPHWQGDQSETPGQARGGFAHGEGAQGPNQAEAITVEYARLFAVPGEHAVQPYESVYCDTLTIDTSTACSSYFASEPPPTGLTGFLYGPSAVAVGHAYRRAGFELDPAGHALPDHLAIELEFMGRLLERGKGEVAKVFFSEHLGRWAFRCLADIKARTDSAFYRTVAETAERFLQADQRLVIGGEEGGVSSTRVMIACQ